jgi:hypothetical protein
MFKDIISGDRGWQTPDSAGNRPAMPALPPTKGSHTKKQSNKEGITTRRAAPRSHEKRLRHPELAIFVSLCESFPPNSNLSQVAAGVENAVDALLERRSAKIHQQAQR